MNNSLDDTGYGITYIFPSDRQLTRNEMIAAITKQRENKSAELLEGYLHHTKEELTDGQKETKAKELLEEHLKRGGTVMIAPLPPETDPDSTVA